MPLTFADPGISALPLHVVSPEALPDWLSRQPESVREWVEAHRWTAGRGRVLVLPGADSRPAAAVVGRGDPSAAERERFGLAAARDRLPPGAWRLEGLDDPGERDETALGWLLAGYRFGRYTAAEPPAADLVAPEGVDRARVEAIAAGEAWTRDLINMPARDMGPAELEAACRDLCRDFGGDLSVVSGERLDREFPLIATVGAASPRAPRLMDLRHGAAGPQVTLIGKGVCFDTGGLNLKPAQSMALMKKDMGGAATVLGLARMILALGLPLRLRVLIPAVENAISGASFRPGDILTARNGRTVEVNDTDAEGRLVLADALSLAAEEEPDLLVSMATLTGAARVALGPDIAPFYVDDDAIAAALARAAARVRDPVWRMPFHPPYEAMIEPGIADLDNAPKGGFAGSIAAALFLRRFAGAGRFLHFDIFGWQPSAAPARPKGGVGQGARALLEALPEIVPL